MPRTVIQRSDKWVEKMTTTGLHAVGGVSGLCLQVMSPTSRSWVLRAVMPHGQRRRMGLGPYPLVSLKEAREKARRARLQMLDDVDPIAVRERTRSALRAAEAKVVSFKEACVSFIANRENGWRNARSATAWTGSLEKHAYPVIGDLAVADVDKAHLIAILKPLWTNDKAGRLVTAMRLRGRIEKILDYARECGWRPEGPNPAIWKGRLENALTDPSQLRRVKPVRHQRTIPYSEIAAFMGHLRTLDGVSARCLELAILTACRSGEARGCVWSELHLDAATPTWVIPKDRMKAGREHHIPLSRQAVALLKAQPRFAHNDLVFPSPQSRTTLSDMALLALMRRMKSNGVPHGMRSCFRTWVAERTNYPREIGEASLAHTIGETSSERPYLHTTFFDKRAVLLQMWADFTDKPWVKDGGNVVVLGAAASA